MRGTIAYRKESVGILNIVMASIGVAMFLMSCFVGVSIASNSGKLHIVGATLAIVGIVETIRFFLVPSNIIVLDDDDTLLLPKGIKIPLTEVYDVSYRCASARGIRYRYGWLILTTAYGRFKYDFVEDCEETSKYLTKLVYDAKRKAESK